MVLDWFLPESSNELEATKAKVMSRILLSLSFVFLSLLPFKGSINSDFPFDLMATCFIGFSILFKYTGSIVYLGNALCFITYFSFLNLIPNTGGIFSVDMLNLFFIPLAAFTLIGKKSGIFWAGSIILTMMYFYFQTDDLSRSQIFQFPKEYYLFMGIVYIIVPCVLQYFLVNENSKMLNKIAKNKEDLALGNQKLLKAKEELKETNKELERFAFTVSHDLKQPINTISNFSNLLEKQIANKTQLEQTDQIVHFISESANRMGTLVDELLAYARSSHTDLDYQSASLTKILNEVLIDLDAQINNANGFIISEELPKMQVLPVMIQQLFQNIISNALKFKKQAEDLQLKITVDEKEDNFLFHFSDNGIGVKAENVEKMFVPFKKLSQEAKGSGIGLATCKKIVELHKGKIWATSTYGAGTTIHFTIAKNLSDNNPASTGT